MTIFDDTIRPHPKLLFKRGDVHDVRLGEVVHTHPDDYPQARVVLLGLPQDEGVARNGGRIGAKNAPNSIRQALYKLVQIPHLALFDMGDTRLQADLEATHDVHYRVVHQILADDKMLIVLGGGNDTSYPDCSALSDVTGGDMLVFNIDAHFDVRIADRRNSGTAYRQLLEEQRINAHQFHEVGYQPFANSPSYLYYLQEKGAHTHSLAGVHEVGLDNLLRRILSESNAQSIFWGLDMDVVRAADAPGVSAPNPTGLTGEECTLIGAIAGADNRTRLFEICEMNPVYDIDGRTARLVASTIWHFLHAMTHIRK
jgi:formiminoglutamase